MRRSPCQLGTVLAPLLLAWVLGLKQGSCLAPAAPVAMGVLGLAASLPRGLLGGGRAQPVYDLRQAVRLACAQGAEAATVLGDLVPEPPGEGAWEKRRFKQSPLQEWRGQGHPELRDQRGALTDRLPSPQKREARPVSPSLPVRQLPAFLTCLRSPSPLEQR